MDDSTNISFYLRYNTVHVFVAALREIGNPLFIRFLVHPEQMKMVMQAYHKKDFRSFRVPKSIYGYPYTGYEKMQVTSKAFCELLAGRLHWDMDKSYRVPGRIYPSQKLVCFDLNKAVMIRQDKEEFTWSI